MIDVTAMAEARFRQEGLDSEQWPVFKKAFEAGYQAHDHAASAFAAAEAIENGEYDRYLARIRAAANARIRTPGYAAQYLPEGGPHAKS